MEFPKSLLKLKTKYFQKGDHVSIALMASKLSGKKYKAQQVKDAFGRMSGSDDLILAAHTFYTARAKKLKGVTGIRSLSNAELTQ